MHASNDSLRNNTSTDAPAVVACDASLPLSALRAAITAACRGDETIAVQRLLAAASGNGIPCSANILARELVQHVRRARTHASGVDALMQEFSLSSTEGVALMCMAEALLRIPDKATADSLIADKLAGRDWQRHLHRSPSLFVNAAAWGLLITGGLVAQRTQASHGTHNDSQLGDALHRLVSRAGEPVIRKGMQLAMHLLGKQFVAGRTIAEALDAARDREARGYRHSYDMLGEAALTADDTERYTRAYEAAIHAIGCAAQGRSIVEEPSISIKLSALHPRYSRAQRERVLRELLPRLKHLALLAKHYGIGLSIDAEEADRLELSLDLIEALVSLVSDSSLNDYDGLGVVVQAYQKRCPFVIDYLIALARRHQRRIPVRLVKGAYWDAEIKRAQVDGLPDYPVYTRKVHTDVSYLICARKMLAAPDAIYPQFATHNAHTLATIHAWAQEAGIRDLEFQCLHGMGETLYDQVIGADTLHRPCRIYAPVGTHETLLAYLVRRLLENGANTSFVNQIVDESVPLDSLLTDPFAQANTLGCTPHPRIPLPPALFGAARVNSQGLDLASDSVLQELDRAWQQQAHRQWQATPLLAHGTAPASTVREIRNPADRRDRIGSVQEASRAEIEQALASATQCIPQWKSTPVSERAALLLRAADLFEQHRVDLTMLAVREAGKSLPNALGEVREAIDFLRYYASQRQQLSPAAPLGAIACISPWNFPLAIFIGQLSAALAAGNVVLAKPAEQTPLIAYRAVQLLHEAGIPRAVLQLLPGPGESIGAQLVRDPRIDGVVFTGSTDVARLIHRTLARRMAQEGRELALIAETGGQNAMIVDSSALPEQVVQDAMVSAFDSAGQRCSALRVLCLQEEIADKVMTMLKGAMQELVIGDPSQLSTDVGPVIDDEARVRLLQHIAQHQPHARAFFQLPLPAHCMHGSFVPPTLIEIESIAQLRQEVFGPVLHVLRYSRNKLPTLIDAINATGYGLTLGIQSRIDATVETIIERAHVGNIYVNRNIIGAVVGVQPFGGEGLSGTGPKAGGPWMLKRLQHASSIDATLPEPELTLNGPTGENNILRRHARGVVLCSAADAAGLRHQINAVLTSGNQALLLQEQVHLVPSDLSDLQRQALRFFPLAALGTTPIHLALLDTRSLHTLAVPLSERDGPLVPILHTRTDTPIPLWRLLTERAICINTAAAGGNASLMAMDA